MLDSAKPHTCPETDTEFRTMSNISQSKHIGNLSHIDAAFIETCALVYRITRCIHLQSVHPTLPCVPRFEFCWLGYESFGTTQFRKVPASNFKMH